MANNERNGGDRTRYRDNKYDSRNDRSDRARGPASDRHRNRSRSPRRDGRDGRDRDHRDHRDRYRSRSPIYRDGGRSGGRDDDRGDRGERGDYRRDGGDRGRGRGRGRGGPRGGGDFRGRDAPRGPRGPPPSDRDGAPAAPAKAAPAAPADSKPAVTQPTESKDTKMEDEINVARPADMDDETWERTLEMYKVMGIVKFGTTKNKKIPGNDKNYAVRKDKRMEARQYMNRTGGFNRPLSPSRH